MFNGSYREPTFIDIFRQFGYVLRFKYSKNTGTKTQRHKKKVLGPCKRFGFLNFFKMPYIKNGLNGMILSPWCFGGEPVFPKNHN
jgi:hypothetical protein